MEQGFELAAVGMTTVFVFLTVLIGATSLMSLIVGRYFHTDPVLKSVRAAATATMAEDELVAVVAAAVHTHRRSVGAVTDRAERASQGNPRP